MEIYVEKKNFNSNYISFNKYKLRDIPYLSLYNYFLISRENFYFLVLSLIQLSTYSKIGLLPYHWSPSGPFSTAIPLVLCFVIELFSLFVTYFKDLYKTYRYNYKNVFELWSPTITGRIKAKDIRIGNILSIPKNSIFPVDGLLLKTGCEKYGKITLSNLNGECDIICKEPIPNLREDGNNTIKIVNIKDNKNSIRNFDSIGIINNVQYKINHEQFIPEVL